MPPAIPAVRRARDPKAFQWSDLHQYEGGATPDWIIEERLGYLVDFLGDALKYGKARAVGSGGNLYGNYPDSEIKDVPEEDILVGANEFLMEKVGYDYATLIEILELAEAQDGIDWAWHLTGPPKAQYDEADKLLSWIAPWNTAVLNIGGAAWDLIGDPVFRAAQGQPDLGAGHHLSEAWNQLNSADERLLGYDPNPYTGNFWSTNTGIHGWGDALWFSLDVVDTVSLGFGGRVVKPAVAGVKWAIAQAAGRKGLPEVADRIIRSLPEEFIERAGRTFEYQEGVLGREFAERAVQRDMPKFLGDARLTPTRDIGHGVKVSEMATTGDWVDRPFIIVRLPDGRLQPFYRSSGSMSGQADEYFPFDGFGPSAEDLASGLAPEGWFRKGPHTSGAFAEGTPNHRYGSFKQVSELLSKELGDAEPTILFDQQKMSYDELNEALGTYVEYEDYVRATREQIEAGATTANPPSPMRTTPEEAATELGQEFAERAGRPEMTTAEGLGLRWEAKNSMEQEQIMREWIRQNPDADDAPAPEVIMRWWDDFDPSGTPEVGVAWEEMFGSGSADTALRRSMRDETDAALEELRPGLPPSLRPAMRDALFDFTHETGVFREGAAEYSNMPFNSLVDFLNDFQWLEKMHPGELDNVLNELRRRGLNPDEYLYKPYREIDPRGVEFESVGALGHGWDITAMRIKAKELDVLDVIEGRRVQGEDFHLRTEGPPDTSQGWWHGLEYEDAAGRSHIAGDIRSEFGDYPADWDHLLEPDDLAGRLRGHPDEAGIYERWKVAASEHRERLIERGLTPPTELGLKPGDRVSHQTWGEGEVISIDSDGKEAIIRFIFPSGVADKRLILDWTPIQRAGFDWSGHPTALDEVRLLDEIHQLEGPSGTPEGDPLDRRPGPEQREPYPDTFTQDEIDQIVRNEGGLTDAEIEREMRRSGGYGGGGLTDADLDRLARPEPGVSADPLDEEIAKEIGPGPGPGWKTAGDIPASKAGQVWRTPDNVWGTATDEELLVLLHHARMETKRKIDPSLSLMGENRQREFLAGQQADWASRELTNRGYTPTRGIDDPWQELNWGNIGVDRHPSGELFKDFDYEDTLLGIQAKVKSWWDTEYWPRQVAGSKTGLQTPPDLDLDIGIFGTRMGWTLPKEEAPSVWGTQAGREAYSDGTEMRLRFYSEEKLIAYMDDRYFQPGSQPRALEYRKMFEDEYARRRAIETETGKPYDPGPRPPGHPSEWRLPEGEGGMAGGGFSPQDFANLGEELRAGAREAGWPGAISEEEAAAQVRQGQAWQDLFDRTGTPMGHNVRRIISGGQTGADEGGLQAGQDLGLEVGGWMPEGFAREGMTAGSRINDTEFGTRYGMQEAPRGRTHVGMDWRGTPWTYRPYTRPYRWGPRTIANATDADGTLWIGSTNSAGYTLTRRSVVDDRGHMFIVNTDRVNIDDPEVREGFLAWLRENNVETLNVAGNRHSSNPQLGSDTRRFLNEVLGGPEHRPAYLDEPVPPRGPLDPEHPTTTGEGRVAWVTEPPESDRPRPHGRGEEEARAYLETHDPDAVRPVTDPNIYNVPDPETLPDRTPGAPAGWSTVRGEGLAPLPEWEIDLPAGTSGLSPDDLRASIEAYEARARAGPSRRAQEYEPIREILSPEEAERREHLRALFDYVYPRSDPPWAGRD